MRSIRISMHFFTFSQLCISMNSIYLFEYVCKETVAGCRVPGVRNAMSNGAPYFVLRTSYLSCEMWDVRNAMSNGAPYFVPRTSYFVLYNLISVRVMLLFFCVSMRKYRPGNNLSPVVNRLIAFPFPMKRPAASTTFQENVPFSVIVKS